MLCPIQRKQRTCSALQRPRKTQLNLRTPSEAVQCCVTRFIVLRAWLAFSSDTHPSLPIIDFVLNEAHLRNIGPLLWGVDIKTLLPDMPATFGTERYALLPFPRSSSPEVDVFCSFPLRYVVQRSPTHLPNSAHRARTQVSTLVSSYIEQGPTDLTFIATYCG